MVFGKPAIGVISLLFASSVFAGGCVGQEVPCPLERFSSEIAPVAETPQAVRVYFVRNSNNVLVALKDSDLDEIPVVRSVGNVLSVQHNGGKVDVESTLVIRDGAVVLLDRYLPSGDEG